MPSVRAKESENPETLLRRWKRTCEKAGVLSDLRRREFYEKPTAKRKRLAAAAVKRHAKRIQKDMVVLKRRRKRDE